MAMIRAGRSQAERREEEFADGAVEEASDEGLADRFVVDLDIMALA